MEVGISQNFIELEDILMPIHCTQFPIYVKVPMDAWDVARQGLNVIIRCNAIAMPAFGNVL